MRINRIRVTNFRGFEEQTFEFAKPIGAAPEAGSFHLLVGENGKGKTSALTAISIGLRIFRVIDSSGDWDYSSENDVRLKAQVVRDTVTFERCDDVFIQCHGVVFGLPTVWTEKFTSTKWEATFNENWAPVLSMLRESKDSQGQLQTWPLLALFGTNRACTAHETKRFTFKKTQREQGYRGHFEGRPNFDLIREWLLWERVAVLEKRHKREGYLAVERAILGCVPGATKLFFDADRKELALSIDEATVPFSALSDGQRGIAGIIADLAIRSVLLNPHLGAKATLETPGVVLIDELDLHLHPKWQQRIVDDLRRTFPRVQFIATSHSPFIIQSLRPGELIDLDGHQPTAEFANKGIEAIAAGLMGVADPAVSPRYRQMVDAAKSYLTTVDAAAKSPKTRLASFRKQLADQLAPYADNPAFQAILEMQREAKLSRVAKAKASGAPSKNGHKSRKKDA